MSRPYVKGDPHNILKVGKLLIRRDGFNWDAWNYYWGERWLFVSASNYLALNIGSKRFCLLLDKDLAIERKRHLQMDFNERVLDRLYRLRPFTCRGWLGRMGVFWKVIDLKTMNEVSNGA